MPDHVVICVVEAGVGKAHGFGEGTEDFDIRLAFPGRVESRPGELDVVMTVGEVEVCMFEEGSAGQDNIGTEGGIGHELFEDDGEEIFALEAAVDLDLIWCDRGRIRVVVDQSFDRGIVESGEGVAELGHIDETGGVGLEVKTLERSAVEGKAGRGGEVNTTADVLKLAGEGGQRDDGLDGTAAAIRTLYSIVDADDGGVVGGEIFSESFDGFDGDSGELRGAGWGHC